MTLDQINASTIINITPFSSRSEEALMSRDWLKITADDLIAYAREKLQGHTLRTLYPDSWKPFTIEVAEANIVYTDVDTGKRYSYTKAEIEQFCHDVNRVCSLMPKPDLYSQSEMRFIPMRSCTLAIIVMYLAARSSSPTPSPA